MLDIRKRSQGFICAAICLCVTALTAQTDLVGDVRAQLQQNSFSAAESELGSYKSRHGVTPEYLEALSWMARGAAAGAGGTKLFPMPAKHAPWLSSNWRRARGNSTPNLISPSPSALLTKFSPRRRRKKDSMQKRSPCCNRLWRVTEMHPFERVSRKTSIYWLWLVNLRRPCKKRSISDRSRQLWRR